MTNKPSQPETPALTARHARRVAAATRRASARHLLASSQFRESLAVASPPSIRTAIIAGVQAALAVLLALTTTHLSPWPDLVGFPALGALAALFGRYASLSERRRIVMICGTLLTAGVLLPSLLSWAGATPAMMILVLAVLAGAASLAVSVWNLGGPGAVIIVFAIGAVLTPVVSGGAVIARTLGVLWGAVLAWLVCAVTDWMRPDEARNMVPPPPVQPMKYHLAAAGRISIGCGAAAFVAFAAGWHYPAWAAIGAAAVMQGGHLHITMNRALQRMVGTVVGACIVWAILAQQPTFWAVLIAIVVFQFITEIIIGFNYALGQITVTPMALLMTHLASPITYDNMPVERVLDTIVGAALGIVFALIFSSLDDRAHLASHRRKGSSSR